MVNGGEEVKIDSYPKESEKWRKSVAPGASGTTLAAWRISSEKISGGKQNGSQRGGGAG